MNQPESGHGNEIICPACEKEGQRITCTAGTKSEVIVYHPRKVVRTFCHVVDEKTMGKEGEATEGDKREQHETVTVQAM